MKVKGINYDVGTEYVPGNFSRITFTKREISREIRLIKQKLHCNAIRIYGSSIDRLLEATEIALQNGLEVWLSHRFIDKDIKETILLTKKLAKEVEKFRSKGKIIFLVGNELTLDTKGFVPGNTYLKRTINFRFFKPSSRRLNLFLFELVKAVKEQFRGEISYAAGSWEKVEWKLFDYVAVNLYRAKWNKGVYENILRNLKTIGKRVVITEFGCCSFKGAADLGPEGFRIVDWKRKEIKGKYRRSEKEQANYIRELLELYEKENLYGAFVYTFIEQHYIYSKNPKKDLDRASFGIMKIYSNGRIEPKKAFFTISKIYGTI